MVFQQWPLLSSLATKLRLLLCCICLHLCEHMRVYIISFINLSINNLVILNCIFLVGSFLTLYTLLNTLQYSFNFFLLSHGITRYFKYFTRILYRGTNHSTFHFKESNVFVLFSNNLYIPLCNLYLLFFISFLSYP